MSCGSIPRRSLLLRGFDVGEEHVQGHRGDRCITCRGCLTLFLT